MKTIKKLQFNELPYLLRNIYNPPKQLYCVGNEDNLYKRCIAIVGCRNCSDYGKKMAKYIAFKLAKKGYVIVSGIAKGIDSYAHIGALQANGKTIAVLGHGLDRIYPKQNTNLAKEIIKRNGTIITEYDLNSVTTKENFQERNRIISGLCTDIVIVEAKRKSGALITANFGLQQGREIYAVPGDINNLNYEGTNNLIMEGANIFVKLL